MSIEAIASAAAAVAVSPYLASLTLSAPDQAWPDLARAGLAAAAVFALF